MKDEEFLHTRLEEIYRLDKQRKKWLLFSIFIFLIIITVLLSWEFLVVKNYIWYLVVLGSLLTVIWWYWAMHMIKLLLEQKTTEATIIYKIYQEIKEVKEKILQKD